jgi:hypothetical protein
VEAGVVGGGVGGGGVGVGRGVGVGVSVGRGVAVGTGVGVGDGWCFAGAALDANACAAAVEANIQQVPAIASAIASASDRRRSTQPSRCPTASSPADRIPSVAFLEQRVI